MKSPKVVLIVNCFNSAEYLTDTIKSLSKQIYPFIKILCVDNLSSDNTIEIINKFKKNNKNIYLYKLRKHLPLVKARKKALDYIKRNFIFDYFAFCDSDDMWTKEWISNLIKVSKGYELLYSNGYELYENVSSKKILKSVSSSLGCRKKDVFSSPVYFASAVFSKKILDNLGDTFFDSNLLFLYDVDLFLKLKNMNIKYIHISNRMFYYRIHEKSLSNNNRLRIIKERFYITRKHKLSIFIFLMKTIFYVTKINNISKLLIKFD